MSFFPSSSYLRKLIRSSEERLEFIESEELLPKNAARRNEILKVKSDLKTEIARLKQDLKLTEEPDPVNVKKEYAKTPPSSLRSVPFNDWSQERLIQGSKTATSRTKQYGNIGDTFQAGDKTFEITEVSKKSLRDIAQNHYLEEGAKSEEEFIEVWNSLHPKGFDPEQVVYFHKFRELPLSPVTDKEFIKNTENFPFITYEPRPPVKDAIRPKETDISSFAPQWFSRFDKKETTFFADWMENQEENLRMVLDGKTGIYSVAISHGNSFQFEHRTVNIPEKN